MSAFLVANFAITNPAGYKSYVFAVMPTLEAHGAEVLVADYETEPLEGGPGSVTVVIKFASREALKAWYQSPEYREIIHLRTDNSKGIAAAASGFDLQRNLRILESF